MALFSFLDLDIESVLIMRMNGTDRITFNLKGPTPFPELDKEAPGKHVPAVTLETRDGFAESWLVQVLGPRADSLRITRIYTADAKRPGDEATCSEHVSLRTVSMSERPLFSFCEPSTAASLRPWCIRPVRKKLWPGGGIDTAPLCMRWSGNGWDVLTRITSSFLDATTNTKQGERRIVCKECATEYKAVSR